MKEIINKTKHEQLKEILRKELLCGRYLAGDKFYSQNKLAERFKVSPLTAREAVATLVQEGLLIRSQGKGTFVTAHFNMVSSKNLGLVIHNSEFFNFSFFVGVSQGVSIALDNTEYHSLLISFKEKNSFESRGKYLFSVVRRKKLGGLLITASQVGKEEILNLQKENIPFVLINCFWPDTDFDFVCPNFFKSSYLLVEHLINNGYRAIIYFGGCGEKFPLEKERLLGYRKALEDLKIERDAKWEIYLPFQERDKIDLKLKNLGYILESLKGKDVHPGVICGDDLMAYELIKYLNQKGYRIPEDIGVVGTGNFKFSESFNPPLTTVDVFSVELGKIGAGFLLDKIKGDKTKKQIFLEPRLIIRQSSKSLLRTIDC